MDPADAQVLVHTTSTIVPAQTSQEEYCPLSPFDLSLAGIYYNQKVVFFDRKTPPISNIVERLKKSLSEVLAFFYPFAGRLADRDGLLVHCNDGGVHFVEASAHDVTLESLFSSKIPSLLHQLFPLNDSMNIDGRHLPLLAVQTTQLKDAIAMAFTLNHMIVDGYSTWQFVNSWAQLCRGSVISSANLPLNHNRYSCSFDQHERYLHLISRIERINYGDQLPHLHEAVFHFSKHKLSHLKNLVSGETGRNLSSLKALCAHIWVAVTRARRLELEESTTFAVSVDCRSRLVPPLPTWYFGNAILSSLSTTVVGNLVKNNNGIIFAANLLHQSIAAAQRDETIRLKLAKWKKEPAIAQLPKLQTPTNIRVGGSPRFAANECDFGFGKPIAVRSGSANKFDGKITIFAGKDEEGSVDFEICLHPHSMDLLQSDSRFLLHDL